ncbi:MAG: hypothetical protein R3B13_32175 [Polyangiaceae bacterium]
MLTASSRSPWSAGQHGVGALLALVVLAISSCASDHDALAKKPGSGGTGGSGGGPDAAIDAPADAVEEAPTEPVGDSRITLLHAVADAPRIGFCFAPVQSGVPGLALGTPLPSGGLGYGDSFVLGNVPGIDFATDDVQPIVVAAAAGDLSQTCAALVLAATPPADAGADADLDGGVDAALDAAVDAAPPELPALRALALPVLPQKTLASGYSTLLAAVGCMGGPGLDDPSIASVCGDTYRPDQPTLQPLVVRLSRITQPDRVSLQAVNGRVVSESASFGSEPPEGSSLPAFNFANNVPPGAIAPKLPYDDTNPSLLGFPLGDPQITLSPGGAVSHRFSWAGALKRAGLGAVENGKAYTVVLLGPSLNQGTQLWWNPVSITLLPNSP